LTPVSHPSTRVRRVGGYGYLPEFLERRVGIDGFLQLGPRGNTTRETQGLAIAVGARTDSTE
jgi:hypothetical protein